MIQNFGFDNGAEVAAQNAEIDQNDPDRVRDWKEVERQILKRQAEVAK